MRVAHKRVPRARVDLEQALHKRENRAQAALAQEALGQEALGQAALGQAALE